MPEVPEFTSQNPLAEVFGYYVTDQSAEAKRYRKRRLCPFNNKVPNCTKDKARDPLGVCSIQEKNEIVITCPIRFRQHWIIAEDAAEFFFGPEAKWTTLTEVRLNDAEGKSAGNIDVVLAAYDDSGKIYDFGALEIQAVYISGNVRNPFEAYMKDPVGNARMDWRDEEWYPRPDYLSSSRKRLAPQLIFKGGILNGWKKKMAVALNSRFFNTLPKLEKVAEKDGEVAWMIYDVQPPNPNERTSTNFTLVRKEVIYTRFETALAQITKPRPGKLETFMQLLQSKVDEKLETPPTTETLRTKL